MADFSINDVSARSLGLVVGSITGWRDIPDRQVPTAIVPPRPGLTRLGSPREQPRTITITGHLRGSSQSDLLGKADALALALQGETTKLSVPDGLSRHIYARIERVVYPSIPGQLAPAAKDFPVELRFTADSPYFLSNTETSVASAAAMPMGTGPVRPRLSLTGAATTGILFTLKNHLGATVATMSFPQLVMTAPDVLVVDCDTMTAKKNGTNVLALLSSASDFFHVDPRSHADYASSSWPSVTTNAGTLTVTYHRAWR